MTVVPSNPDLERQAKAVFDAIVDLPSDERQPAIDRLCVGEVVLQSRVESLHRAHEHAENFLDPPPPLFGFQLDALAGGTPSSEGDDPLIGRDVARYRILRRLGAGGMGVVYLAQQDQPRRTVALKIMRAGLASRSMLRRFEHEAEVLGQLRHPGIAQVFEAGTFDAGHGAQPFFAMEFIDGRTLTDFARTHELDARRRLELLAALCDAVHHAHQKGVVHRDLKPDNILVAGTAGGLEPACVSPQPKILDFGVARLTDSDFAVTTLKTDLGQIVGTLPYMSPEQLAADPAQVDTRSDVYALGVIGYELLTGELPLDIKHKSMAEAARIIADNDAPSLTSFNRAFRGDVSTIIGKALEKDRARRYQSASDLGEDIRRYLRHEPISARPATAWYQMRKFARRNTPLVVGAAGALLMLVLGIIGTSVGLMQARESARIAKSQQDAAEKSEANAQEQRRAAQASEREARQQREAALQISRFLQQMLASINPSFAQGRDTSLLHAILDNASRRVEGELAGQPDIAATLHGVIGRTYASIAEYDEAIDHLQTALAMRRKLFAPDSAEVIGSLGDLGRALSEAKRNEDVLSLLTEAEASAVRTFSPEHPLTIRARIDLGNARRVKGDYTGSETLLREALRAAEALPEAEASLRLNAMNDLGLTLMSRRKHAEARLLYERVVLIRERTTGPDSIELAIAEGNLSRVLLDLDAPTSLEHAERALAICRKVLPPGHDRLASAIQNLATMHYHRGDYDKAEVLMTEALEVCRAIFGTEHPSVARVLSGLADLADAREDQEEAERLCLLALEMRKKTLPADDREIALSLRQLSGLRHGKSRSTESAELLREALRIQQIHGENDFEACETFLNLAVFEYQYGEIPKAEQLVREALDMLVRLLGEDHPTVAGARGRLALMLEEQHKYDEALIHRQRVLDYKIAHQEADNEISEAQRYLGDVLCNLQRFSQAEPILRESLARMQRFFGEGHLSLSKAQSSLGRCLTSLGQYEEAERLLLASDQSWGAKYPGSPQTAATRERLAALYRATNRPEHATHWDAAAKSRRPSKPPVPPRESGGDQVAPASSPPSSQPGADDGRE